MAKPTLNLIEHRVLDQDSQEIVRTFYVKSTRNAGLVATGIYLNKFEVEQYADRAWVINIEAEKEGGKS